MDDDNSDESYIEYDIRSECSDNMSKGLTWQDYINNMDDIFHDMSKLEREEKIKELEQNLSSHEKIAKECADDYKYSLDVAKEIWKSIEHLVKNELKKEPTVELVLSYFFNLNCLKDENFEKALWLDDNVEYDWIEDWKKNKAITVGRTGIFQAITSLDIFRRNVSKSSHPTDSIVSELKENDILPPNRSYLESRYSNLKVEPNIGILKVEIEQNKIDNLTSAMNDLVIKDKKVTKVNCDYDIDDLIKDINDKLQIKLTSEQQDQIRNKINNIKENNTLSILPMIKQIATNSVINEAAKIDQTYRVGVQSKKLPSGKQVIGTEYSSRVRWVPPYTDPHFSYLSDKIEYWVPKVHMVSGLPVWKEREEIKKTIKEGTKVYLKFQTVKVKNEGDNVVYLDYFRKFLDFNDFLKSWQESYVKKYLDIGKTIINDKENITLLSLKKRQRFLKKIKDIREYFIKELSNKKERKFEEKKLEIYISDEVVNLVIDDQPAQPEKFSYLNGNDSIKEYVHMIYPNNFKLVQKVKRRKH